MNNNGTFLVCPSCLIKGEKRGHVKEKYLKNESNGWQMLLSCMLFQLQMCSQIFVLIENIFFYRSGMSHIWTTEVHCFRRLKMQLHSRSVLNFSASKQRWVLVGLYGVVLKVYLVCPIILLKVIILFCFDKWRLGFDDSQMWSLLIKGRCFWQIWLKCIFFNWKWYKIISEISIKLWIPVILIKGV